MADAAGITKAMLSAYETGKQKPSLDTLEKILAALDGDLNDLHNALQIVNERPEAGASLPHTHAQLYGLPFVPTEVARERERFGAYTLRTMGGNLLGDLVQEEVRRGERVIAIDDEAVMMAPYGARLPFQMLLAPRRPGESFTPAERHLLDDLAQQVGLAVQAVCLTTDDADWPGGQLHKRRVLISILEGLRWGAE